MAAVASVFSSFVAQAVQGAQIKSSRGREKAVAFVVANEGSGCHCRHCLFGADCLRSSALKGGEAAVAAK